MGKCLVLRYLYVFDVKIKMFSEYVSLVPFYLFFLYYREIWFNGTE